jgi:hypothetical protein
VLNFNIKTKIHYQGKEYSDPSQLAPEIRAAYEKALKGESPPRSHVSCKFVVNGREFPGDAGMPANVRQLCDDVMSVIENNGEVTLPGRSATDSLITKRQWQMIVAFGAAVLGFVAVLLSTR